MEKLLNNGFCEMNSEELEAVDGGIGWVVLGVVLVWTATQCSSCSNNKKK